MKCITCGEYYFGLDVNHRCPPLWYCIHAEDYGNDVFPPAEYMTEDGDMIRAIDAEKAALKFAEQYQASSSWYPADMTVFVMDKHEEKIYKYVVNQESVPSYWISHLYEPEITDAVHEAEPE